MGADAAKEALQKGKARLVLLAGDLSPRSERNARAAAEESRTPVRSAGVSTEESAGAVGDPQADPPSTVPAHLRL